MFRYEKISYNKRGIKLCNTSSLVVYFALRRVVLTIAIESYHGNSSNWGVNGTQYTALISKVVLAVVALWVPI